MPTLDQMTDRQIAAWVVSTCLSFGASVSTAYRVAGIFIHGLERNRARTT